MGIARTVAQVTFVARGVLQADNAPTVAKGASADLSASVANVPWDVRATSAVKSASVPNVPIHVRATGALPTVLDRNAH